MDDTAILKLYQARDEEAILHTDEQYGEYCRRIAMRILRDELDVEECVSDTYWHVWRVIPPQTPDNLRVFLGKITRNAALDRLEKRQAQKRGAGQVPLLLDELVECIPCHTDSTAQTDAIVIRDTLDRFLSQLPPRERWLFLRRYWYADSIEELATAAHMRENHVCVTLHRVRNKLRKVLEKEGIIV